MIHITRIFSGVFLLILGLMQGTARGEIVSPQTYYPTPYGSYTRMTVSEHMKVGRIAVPLELVGSIRLQGNLSISGRLAVGPGIVDRPAYIQISSAGAQGRMEIKTSNSALLLPHGASGPEGSIAYSDGKVKVNDGSWRSVGEVTGGVYYIFSHNAPPPRCPMGSDGGYGVYSGMGYSYARYSNGGSHSCSYSCSGNCGPYHHRTCSYTSCSKKGSCTTHRYDCSYHEYCSNCCTCTNYASRYIDSSVYNDTTYTSYVRTCVVSGGYMLSTLAYGSLTIDESGYSRVETMRAPSCPTGFYDVSPTNQRTIAVGSTYSNKLGYGGFGGGYYYYPAYRTSNYYSNGMSHKIAKYIYIKSCVRTSFY